MINKKTLSIIIICYNNEKYIKNCLDSVIRKLNNNIEIIIVDDGSTDSSYNIISKRIVNIENIKLISIKNSGISIARNVGLKNSVGKYIMFIDGDDYINIKGIEKIINYIQKNEFDLLLFNTIKYYEKTGKYEIEKYAINDYKNVSISDLIDNKICGRAWRFIYNKKMLDKNKLSFHKSLIYEDEEWVPQVIYYSKKIEYIDEDLYIYRKRNNSITSTKSLNNIINLEKITEATYIWSLDCSNKKNYIFFSLTRCIRNIMGSILYLDKEEIKQVISWYKQNYKMIMKILKYNPKLKILLKVFGPYNGIKFYKKFCKEKYKTKKIVKFKI